MAFGLESCTDWLSLKPQSELILDDYWQSESQAQAVAIACYRGLNENDNMERMIVWGELRSDNLVSGATSFDNNKIKHLDMGKILNVDIDPYNKYSQWSSMYHVINNCNSFLYYAPGVVSKDPNFTVGKLHSLESEVLTIRALCYFYLVRTFKEVPWIETPSIDDTQNYNVAKSTEREVLDHIISDLLRAKKSARTDYGRADYNKGRITLNAVNALLADVYLWDQQYDKCVESSNEVLADPTLILNTADLMFYNVFYKGNSSESIFELQFNDDLKYGITALPTGLAATKILYGFTSTPGELAFPRYLQTGEYSVFNYPLGTGSESKSTTDVRFSDFIVEPPATSTEKYATFPIFKYVGVMRTETSNGLSYYSVRSTTPKWIVYRLADVILMKAEALAQLDGSANLKESLELVNRTYLRSNPTSVALDTTTYNDKRAVERLVLRERQRELLFEGKRWFDLMRLARRNNSPTSVLEFVGHKLTGDPLQQAKMSDMRGLYMPIPQSDIDVNPKLIQNSFYDESNVITLN